MAVGVCVRPGWRLVGVAAMFFGLFGILALRLWYLQVSAIDHLLETAQSQQLLKVATEAPRGDIFDRNGFEIVGSRAAFSIVVDLRLAPPERVEDLMQNLAALLDTPASVIKEDFEAHATESRFRIEAEVSEATAAFVMEHNEDFPGITVEPVPARVYHLQETAAHVVGYLGAPGEADLRRPGITPLDRVGKFGIEGAYARLEEMGQRLGAGLQAGASAAGVPLSVVQAGSTLTAFFRESAPTNYSEATTSDTAAFGRFHRAMLERGVHLAPSQYEGWFLSLAHDEALIDRTIEAAGESFVVAAAG